MLMLDISYPGTKFNDFSFPRDVTGAFKIQNGSHDPDHAPSWVCLSSSY